MSFLDDELSPGLGDIHFPFQRDAFRKPKSFNFKTLFLEEFQGLSDTYHIKFIFSPQKENFAHEIKKEVELLCAISGWLNKVFLTEKGDLPRHIKVYLNILDSASLEDLESTFFALKKINLNAEKIEAEFWPERQEAYLDVLKQYFSDIN